MERRAVGTAADGAIEELANQRRVVHAFRFQMSRWLGNRLSKRYFPLSPSAMWQEGVGPSSSHNDDGARLNHVRAANADSSGGKRAGVRGRDPPRRRKVFRRKARPSPRKPSQRLPSRKPSPRPPVAGNAEPTLIGQFGTWGAYTAMPNGQEGVLRARQTLVVETNPPNRPRDPAYAFVSTPPGRGRSSTKFPS